MVRARRGLGLVASAVVLLVACGGSTSVPGDERDGSAGDATGSSSGGGSGSSSSGSSSGTSSGADASGGPCTTDAQCGAGHSCGFAVADGCGAAGSCFATMGVTCQLYMAGCACDGSEVNLVCNGLPDGYASRPVLHSGTCQGGLEAGADCAPDAGDCAAGLKCCYPCGIPGCHNQCLQPGANGMCPLFP
jgi:hypothetical protein